MNIQEQIAEYINSLSHSKQKDMLALHEIILKIRPTCKLWFLDGKNAENKIVSNPNIGYGSLNLKYADGKSKEFYQIGLSGNTTGISIYIMGIEDKKYLAETYGKKIGKASVTAYCIKFKAIKDIDLIVLESAFRFGMESK